MVKRGRALSRCRAGACRSRTAPAAVRRCGLRPDRQATGQLAHRVSDRSGCSRGSWRAPASALSAAGIRAAPDRQGSASGRRFQRRWTRCLYCWQERMFGPDSMALAERPEERSSLSGAGHLGRPLRRAYRPRKGRWLAAETRDAEDFVDQVDEFHGGSWWGTGLEFACPNCPCFHPPRNLASLPGFARDQGHSTPADTHKSTAWCLELTPSLRIALPRWKFTVFSLMPRMTLTSQAVLP